MVSPPVKADGLPTRVKLSKPEAAALRKLNDKKAGVEAFTRTIMQQGEARLAELQAEGRSVWEGIRVAHDLDLDNVNYNLDEDGETLIPVGMKL